MARAENIASVRGEQPAASPSASASTEHARKAKAKLDDPVVQEEILHPKPLTVAIGGVQTELFPLSARRTRTFFGLFRQLIADSIPDGASTSGARLAVRLMGVMLQQYSDAVIEALASATAPAGELSAAQIIAKAQTIDAVITPPEIELAFNALVELTNVQGSLPGDAPVPK
ncbi:MAG: hypothetical protein ACREM8_10785 [Vulcanimicrobiaceae bacterium]